MNETNHQIDWDSAATSITILQTTVNESLYKSGLRTYYKLR